MTNVNESRGYVYMYIYMYTYIYFPPKCRARICIRASYYPMYYPPGLAVGGEKKEKGNN